MTVDNTSEKPLFYGLSDVLSTMICRDLFLENEIGQPFVDNLKKSVDRHLFLWFYRFLFSACCTNYIMLGVSLSSEIGWRATISRPCISIRYCSCVIAIASSADLGQRNAPFSSLLYRRRNPSPSHNNALIRSLRLPQKRNNVFCNYSEPPYSKMKSG